MEKNKIQIAKKSNFKAAGDSPSHGTLLLEGVESSIR
jgi:hypothetical protein